MTVRRAIPSVVLLTCCFLRAAAAQRQWYVLNTNPASVSRINTATHELTGDVPLPGTPGYALLSRSGAFLYVLLNGAFDLAGKPHSEASSLAVIDVQTMKVAATIDLGWRAHQVAMTPGGEYIVTRSAGRSQQKKSDEIPPQIMVIDTSSNAVAAKWECPRKDIAFREKADSVNVLNALLFSKDLSSIFDFSAGVTGDKEPAVPASLTVYSLGRQAPIRQITFPFAGVVYQAYDNDQRSFAALSPDQRWLYVVETGKIALRPKNRENGKVHVLNVATGKLVSTYDLGYTPLKPVVDPVTNSILIASQGSLGGDPGKLYRLTEAKSPKEWELNGSPLYVRRSDALGGHLIVTSDEIRVLKDTGEMAPTAIRLHNIRGSRAPKVETELKNLPGRDFVVFPSIGKLVLGTYGIGGPGGFYPEDDLALIDLAQGRIERNLSIGRGSVKFGKGLLAFSLTMAVAMATGYAAYSVGSPAYVYPIFGVRGSGDTTGAMAPTPNQSKVWVLNAKTNDVTIVDAEKATDSKKMAVGTGCGRIVPIADKAMACVVCDDEMALLDLKEETIAYKRKFPGSKLLDVGWDDRVQELIVLTSSGLVAIDVVNAKVKSEVAGLHEPMLLMQSH